MNTAAAINRDRVFNDDVDDEQMPDRNVGNINRELNMELLNSYGYGDDASINDDDINHDEDNLHSVIENLNYAFHIAVKNNADGVREKLESVRNFICFQIDKGKMEKTLHTSVADVLRQFPTLERIDQHKKEILVQFQMSFPLYDNYLKYKKDRHGYLIKIKHMKDEEWIRRYPKEEYGYKDHQSFLRYFREEPGR